MPSQLRFFYRNTVYNKFFNRGGVTFARWKFIYSMSSASRTIFVFSKRSFVMRFLYDPDDTVNFVAELFKFTPILWILWTYCFQLHDVSFMHTFFFNSEVIHGDLFERTHSVRKVSTTFKNLVFHSHIKIEKTKVLNVLFFCCVG